MADLPGGLWQEAIQLLRRIPAYRLQANVSWNANTCFYPMWNVGRLKFMISITLPESLAPGKIEVWMICWPVGA